MNLHGELHQYVVDKYLKGREPTGFDEHFDLISSGILNSLALVDLLAHVENNYGIEFGEYDIVPENLESIDALAQYINQQLGPNSTVTDQSSSEVDLSESAPTSPQQSESSTFADEPIAVVGMGCRFPGSEDHPSDTPEAFWQFLRSGLDVVTEFPKDRWDIDQYYDPNPETPGKTNVRHGYFIENIDQFDPDFFGITPREAVSIDPQQRLLLEVCWETLENAGIAPRTLRGSQTGVFIGGFWDDYSAQNLYIDQAEQIDTYRLLSNLRGMMAGRISYVLGLQGPALQVDTACSSSLVSIHLACQSLRTQECNLALAGGVDLNLSPERTIGLSRMQALAVDGRSKSFDESADGFGQGEGCGIVALKRLSDALRDGDQILALVRGSAINHDGRSNGLTVPNGLAQKALIQQAMQNAGVNADQIQFVETHGTGTPLGDPTEISALANAMAGERPTSLMLGSVKTNIGHLNSAAGVASFIKVVLSHQHQEIPGNLHLHTPNSRIAWQETSFDLPTEPTAWHGTPRLAGISSFGMTGTNAHLIVEEAPAVEEVFLDDQPITPSRHLLTLSAKNPEALQALVQRYSDFLHEQSTFSFSLADICYTAATGRNHFAHRLSISASSLAEMQTKLANYAETDYSVADRVSISGLQYAFLPAHQKPPKLAFLFTGQGAQYVDMGHVLYATSPTFRAILDECDALLQAYLDESLLSVLFDVESTTNRSGHNLIDQTAYTQPALFVLEYALATLWQSWGIQPDLLMGHSVGEITAACVAGVFSLEDGLRLIAERGRLLQALPQNGTMVSVAAGESRVQNAIASYPNEVSIAAINGLESIVISGNQRAISAIVAQLTTEGIKTRQLTVSHAFHSPLVEPMLDEFRQVAMGISYNTPQLPLISNVTGALAGDDVTTPDYWVRHVREAVRFADGVETLYQEGIGILLEIGPKPTVVSMAGQIPTPTPDLHPVMLPSLREKQDDWQPLQESLGTLYVNGMDVDWARFYRDYPTKKVVLPTYPWRRQRYWIDVQPNGTPPPDGFSTWLASRSVKQLADWITDKEEFGAEEHETVIKVLATLNREQRSQQVAEQVQAMLYEVTWEQQRKSSPVVRPTTVGRWLILADEQGVGAVLREELVSLGETVHLITAAADLAQITDYLMLNDNDNDDNNNNALQLRGVIHLWGLDDHEIVDVSTLSQSQERHLASVLHVVQWMAKNLHVSPHLWVVTQGAQQLSATEDVAITQTPLWGLGRVIALEHPTLWGGLLDLEATAKPLEMARSVLGELLKRQTDGETQVAYRKGVRHVARLVRGKAGKAAQTAVSIHPDALYLVTGGLGALGLYVANWLAELGAKHLLLTGRRGISNATQRAEVDQLESQGVTVQIAQVDVANEMAMRNLFAQIATEEMPLKGVFHAAGVLDDGILLNLSWQRFATVLSAKVLGGWILHQLTQTMALDMMVFFSSATSLLGHPGQGNYAAANAFLDGLALHRQQQGMPGVSINWGGWADGGMVARTTQMRVDSDQLIDPQVALVALGQLLNHRGQVGVIPIEWTETTWRSNQPQPFLSNFTESVPATAATPSLVQELEALPVNHHLEHMRDYLQKSVGRILGRSATGGEGDDSFGRAIGFHDLGMDSLMATELRQKLERALGQTLPPTIAFEYPTINALASYLLDEVLTLAAPSPPLTPPNTRGGTPGLPGIGGIGRSSRFPPSELGGVRGGRVAQQLSQGLDEPIAVISLACRFPGADTPEAFWQLLQDGADMVQEVPLERWKVDDHYDPQRPMRGKMYTREAAFVDGIQLFDPHFFGISPREATSMDPHHRLLLEVSWETLERAGLAQHTLVDSQTGVFVGIGQSAYDVPTSAQALDDLNIHSGTSGGHSVAAGRLAYTLGLQGPAMAVDTACSSSLVALHLASQSLRIGECDLALAGGVNLILTPSAHVELSQMQALAPDGRSKTFDAAADGYGRGEGCGMVALKRLSDAQADGDTVLAVIKGSAVNHDGPSSGLTVPNKLAQEKLLRQVLSNARVDPDEIGYIEAHGTGTPLGDPIEIRAIDAVFGSERETPLLVGSVKTNIGHLEAAAGIAGFAKTVLALHHAQIPPHLHFNTPNPYIEWDEFAIDVPTTNQPWAQKARIAGISAFGFSGTNAHVIVAAAPELVADRVVDHTEDDAPTHQLLPLSAKSETALSELAVRYLNQLHTHPETALRDLCYSAMVTRNHFKHRVGLVTSTLSDLQAKLEAIRDGKDLSDVLRGKVREATPRIAFLFTGQGSQYVEMGRELYTSRTPAGDIFRSTLDQCDALLQTQLDKPLLSILYPTESEATEGEINQTVYTQPALFALEYALASVWQSWGIQPTLLMGHSVGEIAAACVAGVFTLEDGLALVAARARLMQALPQDGVMVSVTADEAYMRKAIAAHQSEVSIAAINGSESVVISGKQEAVASIVEQLEAVEIRTRMLTVSHAFHSPLMEPMLDEFRQVATSITYHKPKVRLISNVTGRLAGEDVTTPEYWVRHVREAVRFADGVATLHEQGMDILLEIGPKPTLLSLARSVYETIGQERDETLDAKGANPVMLPSLRGARRDWPQLLRSLGQLYAMGLEIDWERFEDSGQRRQVALPTYPFQRQRFWPDAVQKRNAHIEQEQTLTDWFATLNVEQLTKQIADRANGSTSTQLISLVLEAIQEKHQADINAKELAPYLYEVTWRPQPPASTELIFTQSLGPSDAKRVEGPNGLVAGERWLVLADKGGVGVLLAQRLQAAGQQVTLLYHTDQIDDDLGLFQQRVEEILSQDAQTWRGIVHLWALDSTSVGQQAADAMLQTQKANCGTLLHLLHARGKTLDQQVNAPVWVATRGAHSVVTEAATVDPNQTTLWGMGRVISLEHPEWWGGLIDLDPTTVRDAESAATALWQEILSTTVEEQVAYRNGQRYVARLVSAQPSATSTPLAILSDGVYLITGGLGALGLHNARWFVDKGARHLILTGRRGMRTKEQQVAVTDLQAKGVDIRIAQVDVADAESMNRLFAEIAAAEYPLRGVVHAAGVVGFKAIRSLQWDDFVAVMQPKVMGGWLLHQLTQELDLDFFISYASGAGIWGGKQHAHYGAANHFLDGLMTYRRSQNLPGLSIAWGPWSGSGMATPEAQAMVSAMGVHSFSPEQGMAIQTHLLNTDAVQVTAADIQWSRLKALYELAKPRRFLNELSAEPSGSGENNSSPTDSSAAGQSLLLQELEAMPVNRRLGHVRTYLQQTVGNVLGMSNLSDRTTGFADLGMDSLMAMELRDQLQRELNQSLPTTIAFEYPTINALARYLLDEVFALTEPESDSSSAEVRVSNQQGVDEPIAVISIACRFPGADTPEAFWQLLHDGVDMVQEIPADRWDIDDYYDPQRPLPGKMYTREGGFLGDVKQFDPTFFGISPREAMGMDPHHRLLLEVSWETLERAGLAQRTLVDSQTGVFIGIGQSAYDVPNGAKELPELSLYASTSGGHSIAAGRLAYTLGLQGPAMAVDTACSSSLVALHLACQSLRVGECDLALAGGVNLILSPTAHLELSQIQALSADGRCKTFDAAADGYGRGEGCGIVALKRLSDAEADGDNILAVVKGSAINHDGISSGLTVPNKHAQEKLLRQVLANAQVTPDEITYIEAHGTGTPLGDPIEIRALGAVFGAEREMPLLVGSVKSNIGHLEAASGIAAFVKTVLALHHEQIPPHLHFNTPNPYIEWDEFAIDVPTTHQPWPVEKRIAGVSAFGFSGTNAHVIIAAAPERMMMPPEEVQGDASTRQLLPLSAKSEMALSDLVARYLKYLPTHPEMNLQDICRGAMVGRNHFGHRLGIVATNLSDLETKLKAIQEGKEPVGVVRSNSEEQERAPSIAFLFTGQGSQYVNMGRELYETQPIFRQTIDRCDELLQEYLNKSLLSILYPESEGLTPENGHDINQTAYTQPALFVLEYALATLWQSWGVRPDILIGHSVGEIVAACVAGVFSLEDGLKLIAARGQLMQALPQNGTMVVVMATEAEVEAVIAPYQREVSIAVANGPKNVVISGEIEAVQKIVAEFTEKEIKTTQLTVSHAFHSPLMEPILDQFRQVVENIILSTPQIPIVSNRTGQVISNEYATPEYWVQHIRETVRFADGVATLHEQGVEIFLEIGPKPTLVSLAQRAEEQESSKTYLPTLRQGRSAWQQILESLGKLYVSGLEIDWAGFDQDTQRRKVTLPTYPFQRERYWVDVPKKKHSQESLRPLIDKMMRSPALKETIFETTFSVENLPFLADHLVYDTIVSPGACQLALVLNAATLAFADTPIDNYQLGDIFFPEALVLPDGESRTVQLILTPVELSNGAGLNGTGQQYDIRLVSFVSLTEPIATHTLGRLRTTARQPGEAIDLNQLRERCTEPVNIAEFYATVSQLQIALGPTFRWLTSGWRGQNEVLGRLQQPLEFSDLSEYVLPPGLLDACFQMIGLASPDVNETMLPFALGELQLYQSTTGLEWWCHAQQVEKAKWNIRLLDSLGQLVMAINGFEIRVASPAAIQAAESWKSWLYTVNWEKCAIFGLPLHHLPTMVDVEAQLMTRFGQLQAKIPMLDEYFAAIKSLDALVLDYVLAAFDKAGVRFQQNRRWQPDQMARQLGVVSQHQRLFERLLEMLAEVGVLAQVGNAWQVQKTAQIRDPQTHFLALKEQVDTLIPAELTLLQRCGDKLSEVLRGLQDPLDLLFPGGDAETLNYIYKEAPSAKLMNQMVHEAVVTLLDDLPAERGVRILEIGAGTGGTTAGLLPHLPTEQIEYVFTDIGAAFIKKASQTFVDYDFIHYRTLDIEQAPNEQGFESHQYDLIIAANVLHATRNLNETLTHVRQLLAPGGRLLLLEGTDRSNWIDLTFGMTDGWWRFADDRIGHPLLTVQAWREQLLKCGFETVIAAPEENNNPSTGSGTNLRQAVIVAQADETVNVSQRVWLLFADESGLAESLADRLRQQGDRAILVYAAGEYRPLRADTFQLNPYHEADYQSLITALPALYGVVHLWGLSEPPLESITNWDSASYLTCGTALHLTQTLLRHAEPLPRLWLVTREAQAVTHSDGVLGVAQAPMIGLRRVIALEHPDLSCVHLDVDGDTSVSTQADLLWAEMTTDSFAQREDQVAWRDKQRYVARLTAHQPPPLSAPMSIQADATYLITGGLGGLGLAVASWLIEQGATHLLLMGRSQPNPEAQQTVESLRQLGATVKVVQADVTERSQVAQALSQIETDYPLRGIIHAVGVLADGILLHQTWPQFTKVLAPKVQGAWHLHTLTEEMPLDFFILFSSQTGLLGNSGQANHAAANSFLDSFAAYRQAHNLPALSIDWGAWSEIGAAADKVKREQQQMATQGQGFISPTQGIQAFAHIWQQGDSQVAVIPIDWSTFLQESAVASPFFAEFATQPQVKNAHIQSNDQPVGFRQLWQQADVDRQASLLMTHLQSVTAKVLGFTSPDQITARQGLMELGLDSLTAIELRNHLVKSLEQSLPSTLLFDYPTLDALSQYINQEILTPESILPVESEKTAQQVTEADEVLTRLLSDDSMTEIGDDMTDNEMNEWLEDRFERWQV